MPGGYPLYSPPYRSSLWSAPPPWRWRRGGRGSASETLCCIARIVKLKPPNHKRSGWIWRSRYRKMIPSWFWESLLLDRLGDVRFNGENWRVGGAAGPEFLMREEDGGAVMVGVDFSYLRVYNVASWLSSGSSLVLACVSLRCLNCLR